MMTAEQLKASIYLQLFSGKLTDQKKSDGKASELLRSIEKYIPNKKKIARIIRQEDGNYFEVNSNKKTCVTEEIPFEIPDNWEWVHLNQIAVSGLGKTLNKAKDEGEEKQYLCSINVYWNGMHLDEIKKAKFSNSDIEKYRLEKGDLLICEGGDAGRAAIWEHDAEMYYQNALHRVRFFGGISPYYFRALIEFYKINGTIDSYCKGMTIKHLVQGSLNAIFFPLPPLAEQKRIVAKIEELMPFVEQYAAASTKLNTLNATFPDQMKKSILQQAVMGKLVPQDPGDEPASVLLKKIAEEKKRLIKEGKIKKQKPLPEITEDEVPFDIPESWEWVRLGNVVSILGDGIHGTPQYDDLGEYYFVNGNNLSNGKIEIKDNTKRVNKSEYEKYKKPLDDSTILVSINGTIGNIAYYNDEPVMLGKSACYFNLMKIGLKPYFYWLIKSDYYVKYAFAKATGTTIKNVSLQAMNCFLVPLPPIAEQQRIVSKIEQLMPSVSDLNRQIGL